MLDVFWCQSDQKAEALNTISIEACPSENPDRFTCIDHMHQKKYNALSFHMNSYMNQYLKEGIMATYLMLLNWTDQGIKNVKESPNAWCPQGERQVFTHTA